MKVNRKQEKRRAKLINSIIETSVKKYGEGATLLLSSNGAGSIVKKTISTGSPELDRILAMDSSGNYGFPVGRVIGISGKEASGKTTIAIMAMRSVQRMGGVARLIETEHAFDPGYAKELGLDIDELLISQPDYLEQGLDMIESDISRFKEAKFEHREETGEDWNVPMVIVLDSIAGIPPQAEWEASSFGDNQARGLHARILSKFFRKITNLVSSEQICLICTNQLKTDSAVRFGSKDTEIGGMALKFHASLRIDIRRSGFITKNKDDKEPIGIETAIKTVKNKVMPPYKRVIVPIIFGKGVDYGISLFNALEGRGKIKRAKNTYSLKYKLKGEEKTIVGIKKKFLEQLEDVIDKPSIRKKLERMIDS